MTLNDPNPSHPTHAYVHNPPTNGLGIAGFVTSLVGLLSCGFISPIGLILSLVALTKPPRGFAIAGAVIGVIGSAFLALMGFGIVMALMGVGVAAKAVADYGAAFSSARSAYVEITGQGSTGSAGGTTQPTSATAGRIAAKYTDPWGTTFQATVSGDSVTVISAGRDKQFGTKDDLTYTENELRNTSPTTMPNFK